MRLPLLAAALSLAAASALAQTAPSAPLKDAAGKTVGEASFRDGPKGVLVQVRVEGLTPGWHGAHFHATGDCSDPKFQKSGGHINHAGDHKAPHGLLNAQGPDFGDLPSLYVGVDGKGEAQFFTTLVSWDGAGQRPALKDGDGSALVIHANVDDQATQPIGGAGDRIACAVIK
jgi:superoxide dismutase, Cu-Zn family